MKNIYSFSKILFIILSFFFNVCIASAQYCSPTFAIDCFSWRNQSISIDAINWTVGTCTDYDFTTDTAYLIAGNSYAMSVTNGDWCGCGVWIDFDNNSAFDSTENLFHLYTANQTNNYNFNISIPASVPTGIYRMRVIAGWGTDCYSTSSNGYGPCGSYQYGNYDDFTVNITTLTTGVADLIPVTPIIAATPNPVSDMLTVTMQNAGESHAKLRLTDITGRLMQDIPVSANKQMLDMSSLSKGIYLLNYADGTNSQTLRIVK